MKLKFSLGPLPLLKVLNLTDPDDKHTYSELDNNKSITEISAIYNSNQIQKHNEWVIVARGRKIGFIGSTKVISGSKHKSEYIFTPLGKVLVWRQYMDKNTDTQWVYMTMFKKL